MKKYTTLILVLVLTACLFTGCRGRNDMSNATTPTVLPTTAATTAPTTMPTQATTVPTTQATEPSETIDHGNGPRDETDTTETTAPESRARRAMPNVK